MPGMQYENYPDSSASDGVACWGKSLWVVDRGAPMEYITTTMYTFVESSIFERELPLYLDDDEYAAMQLHLMENPEAGNVIPGSGGVRKLRWKRFGTGKRGGVRVIYYVRRSPNEFWMLTIYAKAKQDNIQSHILKALKEGFRNE